MLALALFPTLGQTCDDLVVCARPTLIRNRLNRAAASPICSMLRRPFWDAEGLQRGRKLQTLTFRDKRALRQECIEVCHGISHEHGKPEQMDAASADNFGAVVRVAGPAMRDRLARSLLLARNTGAVDAYWMAIEVGMTQLPSVSDGTGARKRAAR